MTPNLMFEDWLRLGLEHGIDDWEDVSGNLGTVCVILLQYDLYF